MHAFGAVFMEVAVDPDLGETRVRRIVGAYGAGHAHLPIYYRHDGQSIPSPGIIVVGKIDSGVEALNVPGSVTV
jgi:hypothetical protein